MRRYFLCFVLIATFTLPGGRALGDAIVTTEAMTATTIAEMFIEPGTMRVELEIGAADVPAFPNLVPDEIYVKLGHEPKPLEERLKVFFSRDWKVRGPDGEVLPGRLTRMEPGERVARDIITGEPLPLPPGTEREKVVEVTFEIALPPRPAQLTIAPPVSPGERFSGATIGFVAYHEEVALNDFRYLSSEETIDLDWDDPWYSSFRNRNLQRQFKAPAQGFIYVEPFEVRKEILIRPKDVQGWIDLGLEGKKTIAAEDNQRIKDKVAEFLGEKCLMTVDGEPADFVFDRIHFVQRSLRKTSVLEEDIDLPLNSAMLGVIYVHRRDGLPQEVTMKWDLFNDRITEMRGATNDEAGSFPMTVTPDDPVLVWTNYLKNPTIPSFVKLRPPPAPAQVNIPVLSLVCGLVALAGIARSFFRKGSKPGRSRLGTVLALAGVIGFWTMAQVPVRNPFAVPETVTNEAAKELITGLLRNVYRAFDYREEEVIYDSLARSVSGDLLTEVYLDVRKALELQSQGGAKVKVDRIAMLESEKENLADSTGFRVRCRWNVSGKVSHWGHTHTRTNQYEALFTVEDVDGKWRITGREMADVKRVG